MARGEEATERKTGVAGWRESQGAGDRRERGGSRHKKAETDRRRRKVLLVALAVLCVACIVCAWPVQERITRGLWLKGGTATTLVASKSDGSEPTDEDLSSTASTLYKRIEAMGISELVVQKQGSNQLVVKLPWYVDAQAIVNAVCGSGRLEFVRVDEIGDADALAKINAGTSGVDLLADSYTSFMDGSAVTAVEVTEISSGNYGVTFKFNDEGTKTFADATRELAEDGGRMAIVMDGRVITAAGVSEAIDGGQVSITGDFSPEEVNALKAVLDNDALPVNLTQSAMEEIGPLLGGEVILALVIVVLVVFVGVTAFAIKRYGKLGLIITGAMAVFAITLLGVMALFSRLRMFALTLPGVTGGLLAALTVTIMAWLLVDSFYTKIANGGSVRSAATTAPSDAFGPILLPLAVATVAAIVMLFLSITPLRHFGRILVFGLACGCCALLWFGVTTLRLVAFGPIQANPAEWGLPSASDVAQATIGDKES